MPGIEVRVINPETGDFCKPGEPGEMCCRGYNSMKGYYKMPEETAKCIDENGWLHSGDIGVMDEQGYFAITGRLKDMIIRGGENIYPKEIEDFIHHIDGIQDVQVVGVPSKKYGEQPGAFIILQAGRGNDRRRMSRTTAAARSPGTRFPNTSTSPIAIPLTTSGKIMKYKLRELSAELWPDA